jgi:hypothetical protein
MRFTEETVRLRVVRHSLFSIYPEVNQMKPKTHPAIKIFLVVFGLAAIVYGISALRSNSSSWPAVKAAIVSSRHEGGKDTLSYHVTYQYQVGNNQYSDTFDDSLDEYKPGDEITVYYNPASPGTSITSPGEAELLGVIGLVLGLVCVGGMAWGEFKARRTGLQDSANSTPDTDLDKP